MNQKLILSSGWVDCHSHLQSKQSIQDAKKNGITNHIISGTEPKQWLKLVTLQKKYREAIFPTFGLHPYWVARHNKEKCDEALEFLKTLVTRGIGIGEIGLDFRPEYLNDFPMKHQIDVLQQQMHLAFCHNYVMILHIVRAHQDFLRILKKDRQSISRAGIIHGFHSKWEYAKQYLELGFYFSIGKSIMNKNNKSLLEVINKCPIDHILIESDSSKSAEIILLVANRLAELKGCSKENIFHQVRANILKIFSKELHATK